MFKLTGRPHDYRSIIHIFCRVDEQLPPLTKHPQAKLYPGELVTIGVLYALKGGHFRRNAAGCYGF